MTVICCPVFPGCFPESRPWVLSLGAVCNTSQSACDDLCGQGSAGMSMSSGCLAAWFYQCPYFKLLDYRLSRLGHHLEPLNAYLV